MASRDSRRGEELHADENVKKLATCVNIVAQTSTSYVRRSECGPGVVGIGEAHGGRVVSSCVRYQLGLATTVLVTWRIGPSHFIPSPAAACMSTGPVHGLSLPCVPLNH